MRDDHGAEAKILISFCRITFLRVSGTFRAELQVLAQVIVVIPQLMHWDPRSVIPSNPLRKTLQEKEMPLVYGIQKSQDTSFLASNIQRTRCTNQILWDPRDILRLQPRSSLASYGTPGFSTQVLTCRYLCLLVSIVR